MHKCHWYSKDYHQDGNHNGDGVYLGLSIIVNIDEIRSRDGDTDFVLVKENEALAMVVAVLKPHRWSYELHVLQFRDRYLDHGGDRSSGGDDNGGISRENRVWRRSTGSGTASDVRHQDLHD